LTRLDETDEPAGAIEVLAEAGLPLAFVGARRAGRVEIARAGVETVADLLLGGSARPLAPSTPT
jgi:hypothetical protein